MTESTNVKAAAVIPVLDPSVVGTFQDRIIVYPDPALQKTTGGIIIPDSVKEKPKRGTIVLVGPEVEGDCKPGNRIHYGKLSGQQFMVGNVEFVAVRPSEGLLIFQDLESEERVLSGISAFANEIEKGNPLRSTMGM